MEDEVPMTIIRFLKRDIDITTKKRKGKLHSIVVEGENIIIFVSYVGQKRPTNDFGPVLVGEGFAPEEVEIDGIEILK